MKNIISLLLILSLNTYAADEDGSGGTPSSSATSTADENGSGGTPSSSATSTVDEDGSGGRPYTVVVNGDTILHCYANGGCIVINN